MTYPDFPDDTAKEEKDDVDMPEQKDTGGAASAGVPDPADVATVAGVVAGIPVPTVAPGDPKGVPAPAGEPPFATSPKVRPPAPPVPVAPLMTKGGGSSSVQPPVPVVSPPVVPAAVSSTMPASSAAESVAQPVEKAKDAALLRRQRTKGGRPPSPT